MKHVKLFEQFLNEGAHISLRGMAEDESNEMMDFLDEIGVNFEDPGLSGGASIEIMGRVTDDQMAQIRERFPKIADQIESN